MRIAKNVLRNIQPSEVSFYYNRNQNMFYDVHGFL